VKRAMADSLPTFTYGIGLALASLDHGDFI
jgi:hypothetical protein